MDDKAKSRNTAIDGLKTAEDSAGGGVVEQPGGELSEVAESEGSGGLYTGSGKDIEADGSRKVGFLKRKGPMGLIIGLVLGVGSMMGIVQMSQPFSLVEQFREAFNSMQTSTNVRANVFFSMQMDNGRVKNPIKGRVFGSDTFRITSRQQQRLAKQGIEYDGNFEDTGIRVLKFDDGTGEIRIVAADDAAVKQLSGMDLKKLNADYNAEAISFKNLYSSNADFFNGYNKGSLTWRGAIANWFGSLTSKFLKSNKITRNLFNDFQKKVASSESGNTRTVALEMMAKGTDNVKKGGVRVATAEGESVEGEDGEVHTTYHRGDDEEVVLSKPKTEAEVKDELGKISGKMQQGVNTACIVVNTLGTIGLLVSASEALQVIRLTTSYFEAIDKTRVGNGNDAPINELTNALNSKTLNTNLVLDYDGGASEDEASNVTENGLTHVEQRTITTNKTAMESSGIVALYSGGSVDANDPSVQSFNFSTSIKRIVGGLGSSMVAFETCTLAKIATNALNAGKGFLEIAGCIAGLLGAPFTFGASAGACSALIIDKLVAIGRGVAVSMILVGVISTITPMIANVMTRDLITNIGGEDLGNALTSGANMYQGNTHRANGGSLANSERYGQFALKQQDVIAENARYERSQRSPFDVTSKYTFMGNLMTQMMNFLSVKSVMSAITSASSVVSSSVIALSPTASAYNVSAALMPEDEYADVCPYLASIGAVGDVYCNPYSITDMSTIEMDPVDVINYLTDPNGSGTCDAVNGNFLCDEEAEDGNVVIKANSGLAKYILYCDNRTSAWGIPDQNIANEIGKFGTVDTGNQFKNNFINAVIGQIPVIGDAIDVISAEDTLENIGYIGGESCVAGNQVNKSGSPGWSTAQYYQRFIEDQSLAETMGLIGKNGDGRSAVAAFLDDYYEEHPLDNSYEGILARYSGLTKDTVVAILDLIDYYNYIAEYDASTRYAFGAPVVDESHDLLFDSEDLAINDVRVVLLTEISFADVRNRSFAV